MHSGRRVYEGPACGSFRRTAAEQVLLGGFLMQIRGFPSTSTNSTASEQSPQAAARSRHLASSCGSCSTPTARATPAHWAAAAQKRPSPQPMSISRSLGPAPEVESCGHSRMYCCWDVCAYSGQEHVPGLRSESPYNVPQNVLLYPTLKHNCARAEACHQHGLYTTALDVWPSAGQRVRSSWSMPHQ